MKKNNTKFSREIVKGYDRAPSRAMLRGVGFEDKDLRFLKLVLLLHGVKSHLVTLILISLQNQ